MKKSIESIWKNGFLKDDALVAPKVNDLYNQKSIHFVDTYARRFKINLQAIVIGSLLFLAVSFLIDIPITGIGFFFVLNALALVDRKLLQELKLIDKSDSSYRYLKSFERWLKKKHRINRQMASIYYPIFFISIVFGLWFSSSVQTVIQDGLNLGPIELSLVWLIPIFAISILLGIVGGKLYDWDVSMIYGSLYDKLEEMLKDMEALRDEDYTEDDLVSDNL